MAEREVIGTVWANENTGPLDSTTYLLKTGSLSRPCAITVTLSYGELSVVNEGRQQRWRPWPRTEPSEAERTELEAEALRQFSRRYVERQREDQIHKFQLLHK